MVEMVTVLDTQPDREQMRAVGLNVPDEGPVTLQMPAIDAAHARKVDPERYQIVDAGGSALPETVAPEDRPPPNSLATPSGRATTLQDPALQPTHDAQPDTAREIAESHDTDTLGLTPASDDLIRGKPAAPKAK